MTMKNLNVVSNRWTEPGTMHLFFQRTLCKIWKVGLKLWFWAKHCPALRIPTRTSEAEDTGGEGKSILLALIKEMLVRCKTSNLSCMPVFTSTSSNCLSISGNCGETMTLTWHRYPDSAGWCWAWGNWAFCSTVPEGVQLCLKVSYCWSQREFCVVGWNVEYSLHTTKHMQVMMYISGCFECIICRLAL